MDKKVNDDLPLYVQTGLTVEEIVGPESLDTMHVQQAETSVSASETELLGTCADEGDQSIPDAESMPSAVLQTNGEFMCSSCGETTKCARAIRRHISTHISQQSKTPRQITADATNDVGKDTVTPKCPKKQGIAHRTVAKPARSKEGDSWWRNYTCKDCDDIFTSSYLLALHRVQVHRPHKCQKCDMVLTGRRNFSMHVRKEHPGLQISKVSTALGVE